MRSNNHYSSIAVMHVSLPMKQIKVIDHFFTCAISNTGCVIGSILESACKLHSM